MGESSELEENEIAQTRGGGKGGAGETEGLVTVDI